MDNQSLFLYQNPAPNKTDYEWFNLSITILRRDLRPIVNRSTAWDLRLILDSRQSLKPIIDSFDDVNFKRDVMANATPLSILNVFVNSMTEEIKKNPPRAEVRAYDPAAISLKKKDIEILKTRKILEKDRTELQKRVFGEDSQYKIPYDKFNSNVEEFDKMGLDERDDDDLNFFDGTFQRANFEIAGQALVNAVMKLSKFDSFHVQKYVRDAMSVQCNCGQSYVDRVTGEIKNEYIYPEDFYHIPSDEEDGHNDIAKGWLRSVTVQEFLGRVGNNFDFDKDWPYLIWAINYCNNTKYTGFMRGGYVYDCFNNEALMNKGGMDSTWASNCCDWVSAFRYKVQVGYTEWLCPEVTAAYLKRKGDSDGASIPVPPDFKFKNKNDQEEYETESWYQMQLYGSYYLSTTSTSQYLFNYGKVYHTLLEGANDEYARYTCWSIRNQGKSFAEIAWPIINAVNLAYYRVLWILYKAKPEEDQYLINEVIEVAKGIQQQFNQSGTNSTVPAIQNILDQVIQYQRQKTVRIRAYPRIDGKEIGQLPPLTNEKSGIDPLAPFMQSFVEWGRQLVIQQTGFNPMRVGGNPPSRESFKTEQQTLESSFTSTGYVGRMIQYTKEHMATVSLLYAQDVIKFKESIPYKWIQNAIGDQQTQAISALEGVAAHRMAVFVEDMNDTFNKERILMAADMALQQKLINIGQWGIVTQTKDPKRGLQLLDYLERRKEKRLRMQALQDMKLQEEMSQNAHARRMQELEFERETKFGVAERDANAFIASAQINKEGKIETQELKEANKIPQQENKGEVQKQVDDNKKNLEAQQPLV